MTLTVGSLFSGIGGIDLGLERAGMRVVWQVEIDPWCRRVLEKHWPDVERFADVRDVGAGSLAAVDVIAGGFPCQDISDAGKRGGITAARSGLWSEFARIVRELRPGYILVENVAALRLRGLDVVLRDLSTCGYDAEWDCLPASAVGAPHIRDRIWVVAYPPRDAVLGQASPERAVWQRARPRREPIAVPDTDRGRLEERTQFNRAAEAHSADGHSRGQHVDGLRDDLADANGQRREGTASRVQSQVGTEAGSGGEVVADPDGEPARRLAVTRKECPQWVTEPDVGRVAHGVPARVDRLRGLGNAVVPQVVEWIGRRIVEAEEAA